MRIVQGPWYIGWKRSKISNVMVCVLLTLCLSSNELPAHVSD